MMKLLRYTWATLVLLLGAMSLQAQGKPFPSSTFSLHAGPSWYVGQLVGITRRADAYRDDLRKGVAWEADYWYTDPRSTERAVKVGPGVIYQGSLYKAAHEEGSDQINMHYVAAQIGVFFFYKRGLWQVSAGPGYQVYKDKSTVYGKPRDVSMNKLAFNLSGGGEYFLSRHWGLSARLNWVLSSSEAYSVDYHGEHWQVNDPQTGGGYFGQLSLLFGVNYHF